MNYFCQVKVNNTDMQVALLLFPPLRNDGAEFGGSIYQKVNDQLETAVNLAWTAGSNGTRFGIAAKYQLDSSASISVSVSLCCCCLYLYQGSYVSLVFVSSVSQKCVNSSGKFGWKLGHEPRKKGLENLNKRHFIDPWGLLQLLLYIRTKKYKKVYKICVLLYIIQCNINIESMFKCVSYT